MASYVAMLRGVNVSGHRPLPMAQLRAALTPLGFTNVKTYLQSGNVVFDTDKSSADALAARIQGLITKKFGFTVPVLIRTSDEIAKVVAQNPFLPDPKVDPLFLHVTFLADVPPKSAHHLLKPLAAECERWHIAGRDVFLYCPNGYGRTGLSNTAIEKKLGIAATTRNWKSVNALLQMSLHKD